MSSVAAEEGQRGQVAYSASKGAVNAMTLPMARDLGRFGIRVCTIAPGIFDTPMGAQIPKEVKANLVKDSPQNRAGQPDEFSHMVKTIIENGYLNGVHIRVDGAIKFSHV